MTQIARTILNQLGGHRFTVMTGAKDFLADGPVLIFSIPKAKNGINKVRITLEPSDTYKLEFMRMRRQGGIPVVDTIAKTDDIYCDVLQEVFTRYTGLEVSL